VVLTLIGANVAVYMLWQVADPSFMGRHFTVCDQSKSPVFYISQVVDEL
jgi:hypothetical protein